MWLLLALALLFFGLRGYRRTLELVGAPMGSDFGIYHAAARAVLSGGDPATVKGYLYPPSFAVLLVPLGLLPLTVATALWQFGSVLASLGSAYLLARMARRESGRELPWIGWLSLLLLLRLFDSNLSNVQVNAYTLVLLVLAMDAFLRGRDARSGLLVALGAALKVLPAFALFYFLLRRRRRAFWAGSIFGTALLVLAPMAALGPAGGAHSLGAWRAKVIEPSVVSPGEMIEGASWLPGQSLTAVTLRLLTSMPATSRGEAGPTANIAELDPRLALDLARGLALLHLLAFAWLIDRRYRRGLAPGMLEVGLVLALPLILAPLVHKAHLVWLLAGLVALLAQPRRALLARFLMVLGVVAIAATTPALLGRLVATRLLSYNTAFLGLECFFLALLCQAMVELRSASEE